MKDFLKSFNIEISNEDIALFSAAKERLKREGKRIFDFEKYEAFEYMTADIARLRDELSADENNALYCYLLAEALRAEKTELAIEISRPFNEKADEKYDILPIFSLLDLLPDMLAFHRSRGIPKEISQDTVLMFENQVQDYIDLNGRYGICDYVSWMYGFLKGNILRVGRFNFEICKYDYPYKIYRSSKGLAALCDGVRLHPSGQIVGSVGCEDGAEAQNAVISYEENRVSGIGFVGGGPQKLELSLLEWKPLLCGGELVINVHIPSGGSLSPEVCDRDIAFARRLFSKCYGEISAFVCHSWLIDPQIKKLVNKETNLTKFFDRFLTFPAVSSGEEVFEYVWLKKSAPDPTTLDEGSTLKRVIKAHLLSGGHIFGAYGVFE